MGKQRFMVEVDMPEQTVGSIRDSIKRAIRNHGIPAAVDMWTNTVTVDPISDDTVLVRESVYARLLEDNRKISLVFSILHGDSAAPEPAKPPNMPKGHMGFPPADLDRIRRWFVYAQDGHPEYLEREDYALARAVYQALKMRVPDNMKEKEPGPHARRDKEPYLFMASDAAGAVDATTWPVNRVAIVKAFIDKAFPEVRYSSWKADKGGANEKWTIALYTKAGAFIGFYGGHGFRNPADSEED